MTFSTSYLIAGIALGVAILLAFGGGFAVADWRASGELEKARSDSRLLTAANNKCKLDIQDVTKAANSVLDVAIEREKQAQKEMERVKPVIEHRQATITRIRNLPAIPEDRQCTAIQTEQIAYVRTRQEESQ